MKFRLALFFLPLLLGASGCSGLLGRGHWDPFQSGSERRIGVVVNNQNGSAVTVRAVAPGRRLGVGTVAPNSRVAFSIPWTLRGDVRFELELPGLRNHTTTAITVNPGDRVELWVRDPVQQSVVRR